MYFKKHNHQDDNKFLEQFKGHFFKFLVALIDQDHATLEKLTEETFLAKLKKNMPSENKYKLQFDPEGTMEV